MKDTLEHYLREDFRKIKGWCDVRLWQAISPLSCEIAKHGGVGPIAEIGVYHGKFFIGLAKTMGAATQNYAIDVFDMQEFNKDNAGIGDLEIFRKNMDICAIPVGSVEIMKTDSTWIDADRISQIKEKTSGGFSMFSVDGCHTAEHTINDISVAFQLTRPSGIIFVDDYYNDFWPGVHEGIAKLYLMHNPTFAPLAYLCNKLILCKGSYHDAYLAAVIQHIRQNHPTTRMKRVKRFGYDTVSIRPIEVAGVAGDNARGIGG